MENLISVGDINIGNTTNINVIIRPGDADGKRKSRATMLLCPDRTGDRYSIEESHAPEQTLVADVSPDEASTHGEKRPPPRALAFTTGLYLRFVNPEWWETDPPPYMDVTPNMRILSLRGQSGCFPSLETSGQRPIAVRSSHRSLVIERAYDSMKFSISQIPITPCKCPTKSGYWSLRYIHPGRITTLHFNSGGMVVEYAKDFAPSVWSLVNHHRQRGDETYLILNNSSFGEFK